MGIIFDNLWSLVLAGVILFAGVLILRFLLKFAWKIIRAALILISVILAASYFLGIFENFIW